MPIRENKLIISGPALRAGIQAGAEKTYQAVGSTFGPMSGNVAIQKNWGLARITHDGVTVAREIMVSDSVENIGATILAEASKKTLETVGDGTSATVILGYHILALANQSVASGRNPMLIKRGIIKAALDAKRELDSLKKEVIPTEEDPVPAILTQVATISASGDKAIGALVANVVAKVGNGVTIEEYNGLNIEEEIIEGYYFESGYAAPQLSQIMKTEDGQPVQVLVVQASLSRTEDIFPFIKKMYDQGKKKLLVVGRVHGHALQTAIAQVMSGGFEVCMVDSPIAGQQRSEFLQDVAAVTGARLLANLTKDAKFSDLGTIDRVTTTSRSTTLFAGGGDPEQVSERLAGIQAALKTETVEVVRMHLDNRQAKLKGCIGLIRVGGATPVELKEKKDRVEDAVKATQAALAEGVVAGGATALIEVSRLLSAGPKGVVTGVYDTPDQSTLPDEVEGYRIVTEALKRPFHVLMENSGQEPGYNLKMAQKAGYGWGYHAERPTEDPIELFPAGVLDPAKVIKMVVENGCSVAAELVTTVTAIVHEDLEKVETIEDQD